MRKEVYICLDHAKNLDGSPKPSMVEPNYGLLNVPYEDVFTTADGYTLGSSYIPLTPRDHLSSSYRLTTFLSKMQNQVYPDEGDPIEDLQASC